MADQNPLLSVIDLQPAADKPEIIVSALCRNGNGISPEKTANAGDPASIDKLHQELAAKCALTSGDTAPSIRSISMRTFGDLQGLGKIECADGRSFDLEVGEQSLKNAHMIAQMDMQNSSVPRTLESVAHMDAAELTILNTQVAAKLCKPGTPPDGTETTHGLPSIRIKSEQRGKLTPTLIR